MLMVLVFETIRDTFFRVMNRLLIPTVFVVWIASVACLAAAEPRPCFANLVWGNTSLQVKAHLGDKGYELNESDKSSIGPLLFFKGSVANEDAIIACFFSASDQLLKVLVRLTTADDAAINKFRSLQTSLGKKYGKPKSQYVDEFLSPYEKGDGYAEQAVKMGKGFYNIFWANGVALAVTKTLDVDVTYEGPNWEEAVKKARKESEDDL